MPRLIRYRWKPRAATLCPRESVMAKSKDRDASPSSEQPHRALLLELKGERAAEGGSAATALTEMFAALSLGSLQKTLPTSILSITKDLCEETTPWRTWNSLS